MQTYFFRQTPLHGNFSANGRCCPRAVEHFRSTMEADDDRPLPDVRNGVLVHGLSRGLTRDGLQGYTISLTRDFTYGYFNHQQALATAFASRRSNSLLALGH